MEATCTILTSETLEAKNTLERVLTAKGHTEKELAWLSPAAADAERARLASLPAVSDERRAAIAARVAARRAK